MTDLLDLVILFDQNGYIEDLVLPEEVTQQFETGADFLEHYGVNGMKWGVRRSVTGHIKNRPTAAKSDQKQVGWDDAQPTKERQKAYEDTYRAAARNIKYGTRTLNRDPRFAGQNFRKDSPLRREYYNEYSKMVAEQLNASATKKGRSPNGKLQLRFDYNVENQQTATAAVARTETISGRFDTRKTAKTTLKDARKDVNMKRAENRDKVKAAKAATKAELALEREKKRAASVKHGDDELDFSDPTATFLEHYGVKGMKWGVIRGPKALRKLNNPSKLKPNTVEVVSKGGLRKLDNPAKRKGNTIEVVPKPVTAKTRHIQAKAKQLAEEENRRNNRNELVRKRDVTTMTDGEINAFLNRLQLESRYKQATMTQSDKRKAATKAFMKRVLADSAAEVSKALVKQQMSKALSGALPSAKGAAKTEKKKATK